MRRSQNPEPTLSEEEKSLMALRETLAYVARELSFLPNAPASATKGVNDAFVALNAALAPKPRETQDADRVQRLN